MIHYKVGGIEFEYDTDAYTGTVTASDGARWEKENIFELENIFINEIDRRIRLDIRQKLEKTRINKLTGFTEE